LTNIKNDFTIWGNRVGIKGDLLPAHLRCAIDKKPLYYKPLLDENGKELEEDERSIWASKDDIILTEAGKEAIIEHDGAIVLINYACDWRELIYKMAYDYSKSDAKILEYEKLIAIETDREKLK
jgi:hypothetical protein